MAGPPLTGSARADAARRLSEDRDAIARAVTAALYAERPGLLDAHGERGREKCRQDMLHNVDYLVPAVDLGDPAIFAAYVTWLDDLLRARRVETTHLVRCLELLGEEATARYGADEAAAVRTILDAGLSVLRRP
jgi:hypothetical protein